MVCLSGTGHTPRPIARKRVLTMTDSIAYKNLPLFVREAYKELGYRPQLHRYPPQDVPPGKKYCVECEEVKDIKAFTSKSGKVRSYCKPCTNKIERQRYTTEAGRQRNLLRMYGLTKEEYDLQFMLQSGRCACCGQPETIVNKHTGEIQNLSVDHNHENRREVRQLLCNACNTLIGYAEKDRTRLQKVVKYLKRHDM
jgi:recombination endonuclease VII